MFIDEYRTSLKHPEAEELFDLVVFRPLGFLLAKLFSHTPLTPNNVTTLSLLFGGAAAFAFSLTAHSALFWGAMLYTVANILDCADGQLARLQQSGSLFGRIWDGVADYLATFAVFVALGLATEARWLVVVAAVSSGVHAAVFDIFQSSFIAAKTGTNDFLTYEQDRFRKELERSSGSSQSLFIRIYLLYIWFQRKTYGLGETAARIGSKQLISSTMLRLWSFLGPTTNRTILIVSALFGDVDVYLWGIAVGGNLWMTMCFVVQRRGAT